MWLPSISLINTVPSSYDTLSCFVLFSCWSTQASTSLLRWVLKYFIKQYKQWYLTWIKPSVKLLLYLPARCITMLCEKLVRLLLRRYSFKQPGSLCFEYWFLLRVKYVMCPSCHNVRIWKYWVNFKAITCVANSRSIRALWKKLPKTQRKWPSLLEER